MSLILFALLTLWLPVFALLVTIVLDIYQSSRRIAQIRSEIRLLVDEL